MGVPKAVAEAGKRADDLIEKMKKDADSKPADKEVTEGADQAINTPADKPDESGENWEHKYNVLQGKFNAEVPRLQEANQQLQEQMGQLKTDADEIRKELEKVNDNPGGSAPSPTDSDINLDEIREEYGDELANIFGKVMGANQKLQEQLVNNQAKLNELGNSVGSIKKDSIETETDTFWADVEKAVPDWKKLNTNPEFLAWLNEFDVIAGATRMTLMKRAQDELRSAGVIELFQNYQKSLKKQVVQEQEEIDSQIVPDDSGGGDGSGPVNEIKSWRKADIKQFYRDQAKGKFKADPSEAVRIEKEILAAQTAGKVID